MLASTALSLILFALSVGSAAGQKLTVYILAGQSNMQGHAKVETFDYIGDDPKTKPLLARMVGRDGKPRICRDVWISYLTGGPEGDGTASGRLGAGWGARRRADQDDGKIGPEFTFGIRVGEAIKGPVLIIKTAWGGKSLHTDFRPPSAGPYEFDERALADLKKRGVDVQAAKAEKAAATGVYYRRMMEHVKRVLADPKKVVPGYDRRAGFELGGLVWFQGWNDMVDRGVYPNRDRPGGYDEYSRCLACLVRDVREELEAPRLPFVIGVMGVEGPIAPEEAEKRRVHRHFREAMAKPASLPEFRGTVAAVPTAPFWDERLGRIEEKLGQVRQMAHFLKTKHKDHANADGKMSPEEQRAWVKEYRARLLGDDEAVWKRGASNAGYHYLGCAKTMALIGEAFAEAVLKMRAGAKGAAR